MRERTTWNREVIASQARTAEDPTYMNQDHIQQQHPADAYLTGTPSDFAEDIHPSADTWKAEYENGSTARDPIGLAEMRDDTFNHPEKTASEETLAKKANLCVKVARRMLAKNATDQVVEDQALALMDLSDAELINTMNRMAGVVVANDDDDDDDDEQQGQQGQQGQGQQQQKQGQDMQQMAASAVQAMQQGDIQAAQQAVQAMCAQAQQQGGGQDVQSMLMSMVQQAMQQQQGQQQQAPQQGGQQAQQQEQQAQQQEQQALDAQQQQMAQQQAQQAQQQAQQAQQQAQQAQQQAEMAQQEQQALDAQQEQMGGAWANDDQMLDQMLQQDEGLDTGLGQQDVLAGEIQLEGANMDTGEIKLSAEEDAVLSALFNSNTEVRDAATAHALEHGAPPQFSMTAAAPAAPGPQTRTASTRTVGTRPTGGVSQLGGAAGAASGPSDVDRLSSLWASAPDVSNVFGS